jgi:hypothetical protein
VVEVLQEEESEVVDLELDKAMITMSRRRTIFMKALRLANCLASKWERSQLLQNKQKVRQYES